MATPVTTLEALLRRLAREGELYDRLPEQRVRCTACGHRCVIPPGQRGICRARVKLKPRDFIEGEERSCHR